MPISWGGGCPAAPHAAQLLGSGAGEVWLQGPALLPREVPVVPDPRDLLAPTVPCHVQGMRKKTLSKSSCPSLNCVQHLHTSFLEVERPCKAHRKERRTQCS